MLGDMGRDPRLLDDVWQQRNVEHFSERLAQTETFAAFVVDKPDEGIAAVAVGWVNQHLIGTADRTGRVGYVANISTDPAFRRRGYSRATLTDLLTWFRSTGVSMIDLHATADGEHLYRSMGFTDPSHPALTLHLR